MIPVPGAVESPSRRKTRDFGGQFAIEFSFLIGVNSYLSMGVCATPGTLMLIDLQNEEKFVVQSMFAALVPVFCSSKSFYYVFECQLVVVSHKVPPNNFRQIERPTFTHTHTHTLTTNRGTPEPLGTLKSTPGCGARLRSTRVLFVFDHMNVNNTGLATCDVQARIVPGGQSEHSTTQ